MRPRPEVLIFLVVFVSIAIGLAYFLGGIVASLVTVFLVPVTFTGIVLIDSFLDKKSGRIKDTSNHKED